MKRFLKLAIILVSCAALALSVAACGNGGSTKSDGSGLVCKKFGDDEFYTVTRYYEEDDVDTLDIAAAFHAKYGENEKIGLIKKNAFKGNGTLKSVIIAKTGDQALEIEEGAFAGMKAIEEITLPFVGSTELSDATIMQTAPAENKSTDKMRSFGYIFGEEEVDGSAAVSLTYGKESATFYIPSTLYKVTVNGVSENGINIPMYAFCGLTQVSVIELKGNIVAIGESAFKNMTKLGKINIPATVKDIYGAAFEGTPALKVFGTDLSFDDGATLENIKDGAFKGTKLTSFVLPASVKTIGESCFAESSLTAFTFSANIEFVGAYALANSEKLATINNVPNAEKLSVGVFYGTAYENDLMA